MSVNPERWLKMWRRVGTQGDGAPWYEKLVAAYNEPWRHYHDLRHLDECLTALDEAGAIIAVPNINAVEMALWFHDAVYEPKAADNEERSAALVRQALEDAAVDAAFVADVERLVMCTKRHETGGHSDAQWMIDIDLSILGRESGRFDEYERDIRAEYNWVPEVVYAEKRAEILDGFLARESLFRTDFFHRRFELQARDNLRRLIAGLRGLLP